MDHQSNRSLRKLTPCSLEKHSISSLIFFDEPQYMKHQVFSASLGTSAMDFMCDESIISLSYALTTTEIALVKSPRDVLRKILPMPLWFDRI